MVFDYTEGNMTLKVGPRANNDYEFIVDGGVTEKAVFSGNLLVLALSLASMTLVSAMAIVMNFSNVLSCSKKYGGRGSN